MKMDGMDGGWAWIVAVSACLINFIMAGLGRMSGILFVAFIEMFQVDRKGAAAPFSVRSSTRNLLGPVVGILGQKYGVRAVTVAGGIIGTVSAALCFYATDIVLITIIWGGINGVGTALTTTLPQVVIGQYFDRHKTTAAGMAFSGGCVGSFMFPAILEYLLHNYELSGSFLIIAGTIMHVIPCAMILKKPHWLNNNSSRKERHKRNFDDSMKNVTNSKTDNCIEIAQKGQLAENKSVYVVCETIPSHNIVRETKPCVKQHGVENQIDFHFLRQNEQLVSNILTSVNPDALDNKSLPVATERANKQNSVQLKNDILKQEIKNLYCKIERVNCLELDIHSLNCENGISIHQSNESLTAVQNLNSSVNLGYTPDESDHNGETSDISLALMQLNALYNSSNGHVSFSFINHNESDITKALLELRKIYDICKLKYETNLVANNMYSLSVQSSSTPQCPEQQVDIQDEKNGFFDHIVTAIKLYKSPLFLLICACRTMHFITFVPTITVIVDYGMDKGLLEEDGKYIIAALSFGDLVGRLGLGWITDRKYISLPKYMLITMVIQGASSACLPFMHSRLTFLPTIALFGMLQGSVFIRHPVLVSKYMKKHEQSIAMGCINLFSGFAGFGLPHFIGYFRDIIGSYDNMFFITGAAGTFVGLLWALEPYFVRRI